MTILNITNTATVYASGPDTRKPGYNDLRTAVTDIFGATSTGYGYKNPTSSDVTQGVSIRAVDWNNLLADLNLIWQHQTNSSFTPTGTAPATGNTISSTWVNSLVTAINTADTKRYDKAATGQYTAAPTISSTFPATGTWGATIQHRVTLTWPSDLEANYFFNLGGQITFDLTYPAGSYTGDNATWTALIDGWQTQIREKFYDRAKFQTGGTQPLFQPGGSNSVTITVVKTSNRVLTITTTLANVGVGTNLRVTNYFNYEYSTGAFNAPRPDVASVSTLGDTYTPVFVARKTLRVNTPTLYTYQAQQTSAAQTINLNNDGTVDLTVTGIVFNDDPSATSVVTSGLGFPVVISSGTNRSFNLAYTGTNPGNYVSSFTINSDNDSGIVTVPTEQKINAIPFSFTVTPASISITKTDRTEYRQKLNIIPANGSYSSYVPSFPGGQTEYTVDQTPPDGPIVIFTPGLLTANTYATTVRITVTASDNSISYVDVPISINLTAALDQNLGTWVSALAYDNSVVGMSYDIIGGNRYLTIGVGMGADGSTAIASNGPSYVSTAMQNLGINADPNFLSGPVMYKVDDRYWTQFLRTYGAWPNTTGTPINTYVDRIFTFTAAAGTYNYECSFDNSGYFEVDGVLVGDMRGYGESWRTSISGTFEITSSGSHAVTIHAINAGGPGAMGVRITDSGGGEVWSTLTPIRSSPAYLYWQEVYRFPIKARGVWWQYAKEELNSYYYCVKDTAALEGQYRWGDYFGQAGTGQTRSMFIVTDETGNGNLQIAMTSIETYSGYDSISQTLHNLAEAFFYYSSSQWYGNTRYSQLNNGPVGDGSQTLKFVGFDQAGAVQTILAPFPIGGGSGGPNTFSTGSSF